MKKLTLFTILFCCSLGFVQQAQAQENYTEGPVWVVNYYRTKPGKFEEYLKFLRANFAKSAAKQKQAGIVLDTKVLLNPAVSGPDDWDVAIAYLYSDFSKLNFSQSVDDQLQKIAAEISGEANREKRDEKLDTTRFPLRDYIRTRMLREIKLKP
jgi:nanoRNase/pAp phosphatase (c-di-AMP/oligoRNAs hydrolase)